jgi:hypothetical protein
MKPSVEKSGFVVRCYSSQKGNAVDLDLAQTFFTRVLFVVSYLWSVSKYYCKVEKALLETCEPSVGALRLVARSIGEAEPCQCSGAFSERQNSESERECSGTWLCNVCVSVSFGMSHRPRYLDIHS